MRLWHKDMISGLPRMQLLGQHRECCAMRGNGWNQKHRTVNYVWKYPFSYLFRYHMRIIAEMEVREYKPNPTWKDPQYRGQVADVIDSSFYEDVAPGDYAEHNDDYLKDCAENLEAKIHKDRHNPKKYNEKDLQRWNSWKAEYLG